MEDKARFVGCAPYFEGIKGKIPILLAYPNTDNQVKVWCPFCRAWHYHGALNGHRVAHCGHDSGSPFVETGYFIRVVNEKGVKIRGIKDNRSWIK